MSSRAREFVAEDLWLLVAIVTLVLTALVAIAGFGSLTPVVAIIGWFLLTPILLFWGEEIAAVMYGTEETETAAGESRDDALDELKRRYAEGEIDDEEFEHRVDRLLEADFAVDRTPGSVAAGRDGDRHPASGTGRTARRDEPAASAVEDDPNDREREQARG